MIHIMEKNKTEKGRWRRRRGGGLAVLHRVARGVLTHRVGFEQRPARNGRRNDVALRREKIPGRGNRRYKDRKAGICMFQGQQRGWME